MWKFLSKKINRKKTGLVLSSGAARGLAHIGVIKYLTQKGIKVDMVSGSSIGALVGACYAKEGNISYFEEIILKMDWKHLFQLVDFNLAFMFKGFVHGNKVKELLKTIIGDIKFKDLALPLSVVATDVYTGKAVVMNKGSVIDAVRASLSMPVTFTPVKLKGRFLIDGGIVNPVPVDIARSMGAGYIIASNVIHPPEKGRIMDPANKEEGYFSVMDETVIDGTPKDNADGRQMMINKLISELAGQTGAVRRNFNNFRNKIKDMVPGILKEIDMETPNIFDVLTQAIYCMEYKIAQDQLRQADIVVDTDAKNIDKLEFYKGEEAIRAGYKAAVKAFS